MLKEVRSVDISCKIMDAFNLAKNQGLGCLPVVQKDKLVGILTRRDLHKIEDAQSL
jgi:CBS domain-containing protein